MLPHTFGDLGEQPGGQADIHQIHRGIGDYGVQVGGGGEPELIGDLRQLLGGPAEDRHRQRVDGVKINTLRAAGAANLARRAC